MIGRNLSTGGYHPCHRAFLHSCNSHLFSLSLSLLLSGLGAATLLLFNGEILGTSGLESSVLLYPRKALTDPNQYWKLVLLSSFTLTANLVWGPDSAKDELTLDRSSGIPIVSIWGQIIGGFLVGLGKSEPFQIFQYLKACRSR